MQTMLPMTATELRSENGLSPSTSTCKANSTLNTISNIESAVLSPHEVTYYDCGNRREAEKNYGAKTISYLLKSDEDSLQQPDHCQRSESVENSCDLSLASMVDEIIKPLLI
jgi:hypothetical protein